MAAAGAAQPPLLRLYTQDAPSPTSSRRGGTGGVRGKQAVLKVPTKAKN